MRQYWKSFGKYQTISDELAVLIPNNGSVPNKTANKWLEKYRMACNEYYHFHSTGEWTNKIFKVRNIQNYKKGNDYLTSLYKLVEDQFNYIIEKAAQEQNIVIIEDVM